MARESPGGTDEFRQPAPGPCPVYGMGKAGLKSQDTLPWLCPYLCNGRMLGRWEALRVSTGWLVQLVETHSPGLGAVGWRGRGLEPHRCSGGEQSVVLMARPTALKSRYSWQSKWPKAQQIVSEGGSVHWSRGPSVQDIGSPA